MAIAERIRFLRDWRGMTQSCLGTLAGLSERKADARIAQYESGDQRPDGKMTYKLAQALDVSPMALELPDVDTFAGAMHTLFALEDLYGLRIDATDGEVCLRMDPSRDSDKSRVLLEMLTLWQEEAAKLQAGEINKIEYDQWRYRYPDLVNKPDWIKTTPARRISDALTQALEDVE